MNHPLSCRFAGQVLALLACFVLTLPAAAHDDLRSEIRRLDADIVRTPADANLFLRRGEMNRLAENWDAAFADYRQAELLDPKLAGLPLARGRAAFQSRHYDLALQELDTFIRRQPGAPIGFAQRARVLAALGKWREASRDFSIAVNRSREPDPDDYLEWSRVLSTAGDDARAVRVLDAGLRKLGPLVSLALPALDLEVKLKRYDTALRRLDQITTASDRPDLWLSKRASILERAGRIDEAREACAEALALLAKLPDARRHTRATSVLERTLKSKMARLDAATTNAAAR